jgi:ketosteroid isomerase-like protein
MENIADIDSVTATLLSLERAVLDRWNKGDVEGGLEIYAEDVTYFDPITATRIDGWSAVADYFRKFWAGKVRIARYDIVNPQVVTDGHVAALSYNLANYVQAPDGSEAVGTPWNSTQVYRRIGDRWRVAHVHWSFTKHPAFAAMSPESAEGPRT